MQYQVIARGQIINFESVLSNLEALTIIATLTANQFAQDLVLKSRTNGLSDKQWAWVHKLAFDASQPQPEQLAINVEGLYNLFSKYKGLYPKIDIVVNGVQLHIARAGDKSKFKGSIMISHAGINSPFYGVISKDGIFTPRFAATNPIIEAIKAFSNDPVGLAAHHGHATGNCCFCRKKLTDERSVTVGYGEICANNYGLPWG